MSLDLTPARRHVESDPCGPGECPCDAAGYPCPSVAGIHRHPVAGFCAKQKADPAFRARLVAMAREDHEGIAVAGGRPSPPDPPRSTAALPVVSRPDPDPYPDLTPCRHRSGRWSCCETIVHCRLGRGQAGIVDKEDCMPCVTGPKMEHIDEWKFITKADLARDTLRLMDMLPDDIDCIVAISRSGLLPGSMLAYDLHLPLLTVSRQTGVNDPGHGIRLESREKAAPRHVLLIDDTSVSGREIAANLPTVQARFPDAKVSTAAVYAWPETALSLDFCASIYPGMHYLEWNWHNAGHGAQCGYDFDGIISRDFTHEECADDATYRKVMASISPLYLPRRLPVPLIVTARPESTRGITLDWLNRHGVRVDRLVMRDFDIDPALGWTRHIAEYKAYHFDRSGCIIFAESEPDQAEIINQLTGKPVLCPAAGKVFPGAAPYRFGMTDPGV